ncbi:hypothetical protein PTKU64_50610 [Paraburkholderia terrae]|uniref:Spherulation-specific family 4 n=1 Tax=Paraburkholderia terrae TaxID=311230 RepID=A0ABM7TRM1_9BURK|nr:spherulation-specific family 4 protein [Paraburkholderia terrae]BCZ81386.1 hypothetical protein PTKU64_50610 [Paraburkholderia terrae]
MFNARTPVSGFRAIQWLRRVALLAVAPLAFAVHANAYAATVLPLTVPAYFDPVGKGAGYWNDLATTAAKVPTTVILNPDSGPGTNADAAYIAAIAKVHAAGGRVIGYVSTSYAKRSLSAVVTDINRYIALYKIDGFFIDEMTSDSVTSHIQFYQSVYNYIKGLLPAYSVMGNPGANIPELYASLPTADQFVVFEDSAKRYASYAPAKWQASYPAKRFAHMVYGATEAQMPGIVSYATMHGAGSVFVTSTGLPNPYKNLPAWWSQLVSSVLAIR